MIIRKVLKEFINGDTSFETIRGVCIILDTTPKRIANDYLRYIELSKELLDGLNSIRKE